MDLDAFLAWIEDIKPEMCAIGYDDYGNNLSEPAKEKTETLIQRIRELGICVFEKRCGERGMKAGLVRGDAAATRRPIHLLGNEMTGKKIKIKCPSYGEILEEVHCWVTQVLNYHLAAKLYLSGDEIRASRELLGSDEDRPELQAISCSACGKKLAEDWQKLKDFIVDG